MGIKLTARFLNLFARGFEALSGAIGKVRSNRVQCFRHGYNPCPKWYSYGTVGRLLGNGDGTFQTAVSYGSGGEAMSVAIADVNGDGKPDLLVANYCFSD